MSKKKQQQQRINIRSSVYKYLEFTNFLYILYNREVKNNKIFQITLMSFKPFTKCIMIKSKDYVYDYSKNTRKVTKRYRDIFIKFINFNIDVLIEIQSTKNILPQSFLHDVEREREALVMTETYEIHNLRPPDFNKVYSLLIDYSPLPYLTKKLYSSALGLTSFYVKVSKFT